MDENNSNKTSPPRLEGCKENELSHAGTSGHSAGGGKLDKMPGKEQSLPHLKIEGSI